MICELKRRSVLFTGLLVLSYGIWRFFLARLRSLRPLLPSQQTRPPLPVDIVLPDVVGNAVRLAHFRGQPVLINFWATWCLPCQREMPSRQALYDDFQSQGLVIMGIANDTTGASSVVPFMQAYSLRFLLMLDPQNTVGEQLHIPGFPTTYPLDRQGRMAGYEVGARDWNSPVVRQLVTQLLAEKPGM